MPRSIDAWVAITNGCGVVFLATVCASLLACGDDAAAPSQMPPEAGTHGGAGHAGAEAGRAANGGSSASAATAGQGGSAGSVSAASIDDVDLTLGGFNQDLPQPNVDCLSKSGLVVGCVAISGTYNGQAFQMACQESKITVANSKFPYIGCRGPVEGGDLVVQLHLAPDPMQTTAPRTYRVDAPSTTTFVSIWHLIYDFQSHPKAGFGLDATHEHAFRAEWLGSIVNKPSRTEWHIEGAFGSMMKPKSSCTPDAMKRGCDDLRLRGNFRAIPLLL